MIAGLIVLAAAVVLVLIVIGMYNGLVRAKKQVENAWSQIDVQLKRRYDLSRIWSKRSRGTPVTNPRCLRM